MTTYRVRYEIDEAGYWFATVLGVPGCHTQGRSLETARGRVREALGVCVDDADEATLVESYRLGRSTLVLAQRAMAAKRRAEKAEDEAQELLRDAVRQLLKANLSQRDAATVLGLSHQRVAQLAQAKEATHRGEARRRTSVRRDSRG
jgi:predicted RNase H-like HicB family nuclease/predicted XRE-type DNA-binding protein